MRGEAAPRLNNARRHGHVQVVVWGRHLETWEGVPGHNQHLGQTPIGHLAYTRLASCPIRT